MTVVIQLIGNESETEFVDTADGPSYFYDLQKSGAVRVIACTIENELIRRCAVTVVYGSQGYREVKGDSWSQETLGLITVFE